MAQASKRHAFVHDGLELIHRDGFTAAGVAAIAGAAHAPKGSFYNHFASKEAFGVVVLDAYFERVRAALAEHVDSASSPRTGIRAYFDLLRALGERDDFASGCLIGNLSAEVTGASELLRSHLAALLREWTERIADAVARGQRLGEVRSDVDAWVLASALIDAWQGALLRAKADRTPDSVDVFQEVVLDALLGPNWASL